jgi:Protein of unknown function (DUF1592)/Protein of unknown function (DUF1588)/Protein of unknown function (DUF1587)/Protein of unknown function (DUF1585)/Protein of unknown function (DUF1595)
VIHLAVLAASLMLPSHVRAAAPSPSSAAVRRLSRSEYVNAVRDLLGVDVDGAALLPPDETGSGFDNDADILSIPPALLQRYLSAAVTIATRVVTTGHVIVCRPRTVDDEERCARTILTPLARRAYRRPVDADDIRPVLNMYRAGRGEGTFEQGIQKGLELLLVDPEFLYRIERTPPRAKPGSVFPVSDVELASRLSFLLWSSIPDEELLKVAERGTLRYPAVMAAQARRMLADPRASAFASNFAEQWLGVRDISTSATDPELLKGFGNDVKRDMAREIGLFLESQIREDRSILNLLDADYTFLNERLARFYGITGVAGNDFQRVTLTNEMRFGLLGKGAVLLSTSYPNRTSPVLRGKWILEALLGTPPPPPPPNVPALKENDARTPALSARARLDQHRNNPICASCHMQMDPLGLALENFDAVGKWRDADSGAPVDASAALPDGTIIDGPVALRMALIARRDQFVASFTEKLFTYALGRATDKSDRPAIRQVVQSAADADYRWSTIILDLVASTPFRMASVPERSS